MAHSVYYVARGLALNLSLPDLGQPNLPDLWVEIYPASKLPPNQLQCLQCLEERGPDCPEFMYLRVREGRREAVHHNTNIRDHAGAGESDAHKALKERTATTAERAGFAVETEDRASHGRRRTDVLVRGAGEFRLGVEAQLSYITASSVGKRSMTAQSDGITPMWVVNHETASPINRAPWCMVPNANWRHYLLPNLKALGGVRHLAWESCGDLTRRGVACPITRRRTVSCGGWHHSWDQRQVPYDDLIVRAAAQEFVPVEISKGGGKLYYWVPAADRAAYVEAEAELAEKVARPATRPKPRPLDPTCTYGQDSGYRSAPAVPRDDRRPVVAAASTGPPSVALDWRSGTHWNGGRKAPCVHCSKPTLLLDDGGQPAHKVCAEAAIGSAGRAREGDR